MPMKAIALHDFESGPAASELPTPEPGNDELLVRVLGSSVNGFDVAVASGMLKGMMEYRFPVVLGTDFAGTVEQVGAGVSRYRAGDEVFGIQLAQGTLHDGTGRSTSWWRRTHSSPASRARSTSPGQVRCRSPG
jgi:NADPH2:quinone reductase